MKNKLLICVLAGLFFLLVSSILKMPSLGSIQNPSYNEVTQYYLENGVQDTGAPNIIAGIITDYRAFDTLGETTVLFTAIAAVISVLQIKHTPDHEKEEKKQHG